MTAHRRLGFSLAICAGIAVILFAAAERWWTEPAPAPPQAGADTDSSNARIEELQEAIEAQRAALQQARQQRGDASAELDRLTDELSVIRERIEGLREKVKGQPSGTE